MGQAVFHTNEGSPKEIASSSLRTMVEIEEVPEEEPRPAPKPAGGDAIAKKDDEDEEIEPLGWVGTCICGAFVVGILVLIWWLMGGAEPYRKLKVEAFQHDEVLRVVQWPQGQTARGGPNGPDVDWAVFFYKPFCGACRRVRPVFHALARTTNATSNLRFGEVDCVKNRGVCTMLGVETQPRIRLYRASGGAEAAKAKAAQRKPSEQTQKRWKRESVAEWQGLLIAYEITKWFFQLQADGHISEKVKWPSDGELAEAMREFKAAGDSQHDVSTTERPKDPAGFLRDAELALQQGLIDHVFFAKQPDKAKGGAAAADADADADAAPTPAELSGGKLKRLKEWVELQSTTFPQAAVRARLSSLLGGLKARGTWREAQYEKLLVSRGFGVAPVEAAEWRWCKPRGAEAAGLGGYTCGLWLLFHTTLANSDRHSAAHALRTIRLWVRGFFGCAECARHFSAYYDAHDGGLQEGHIEASLWLWRAHNAVSLRLRADDEDAAPYKRLWPSNESCKECYVEAARNGTAPMSDVDDLRAQWEPHRVFEFLQETFCFESDTFVCSGFDDPSRDVAARKAHREAIAEAAEAAEAAEEAATAATAAKAAKAAASVDAAGGAKQDAGGHEEL